MHMCAGFFITMLSSTFTAHGKVLIKFKRKIQICEHGFEPTISSLDAVGKPLGALIINTEDRP